MQKGLPAREAFLLGAGPPKSAWGKMASTMRSLRKLIVVICVAFAAGQFALAQSTSVAADAKAKLPEFEVVSLKPTNPEGMHMLGVKLTKDQLTMNAMTLKGLICVAYAIPYWELSVGEPWMARAFPDMRDHFDLVAKLPQDMAPYDMRHSNNEIGDERIREMMQAMLTDRFHLQFHRGTKQGTASILEQSGKPLLLVPTTMKYAKNYGDGYSEIGGTVAGVGIGFYNVNMPQLAKFLNEAILHHPVIDKTGLDGSYDFRSKTIVTEDDIRNGNTTSMWVPMVKEIGLKVTESTGPVETFVIDHAEPPSAN